jgi:hypothetical protein
MFLFGAFKIGNIDELLQEVKTIIHLFDSLWYIYLF